MFARTKTKDAERKYIPSYFLTSSYQCLRWNIMDQERMLGIQQQLRQNQTELHDFLSDLSGWEKNIKDKDEDLKKSSQVGS